MQHRTDSVFVTLMGDSDFEFTELETVQVLNNVRRRLSEHLEAKKDLFYEQSTISQQKAKEISGAIEYL
jgi:hypothetical protein